jgi:hypothetical protein
MPMDTIRAYRWTDFRQEAILRAQETLHTLYQRLLLIRHIH